MRRWVGLWVEVPGEVYARMSMNEDAERTVVPLTRRPWLVGATKLRLTDANASHEKTEQDWPHPSSLKRR